MNERVVADEEQKLIGSHLDLLIGQTVGALKIASTNSGYPSCSAMIGKLTRSTTRDHLSAYKSADETSACLQRCVLHEQA